MAIRTTMSRLPLFTALAVAVCFVQARVSHGQLDFPYTYEVSAPAEVTYDIDTGAGSFAATVAITEDPLNDGFPSDTQGFSLSLRHDPALLTATEMEALGELLAVGLSAKGPAFWGEILNTSSLDGDIGVTLGVVYDFFGNVSIQFDVSKDVVQVSYDTVAAALMGDAVGTTTSLDFDTLSTPPVANVVVASGDSFDVAFLNASIVLAPFVPVLFVRGDCNDDDNLNIADGIFILNNLFQDGPAGTCAGACDTNGDNLLDQSDAISIFNYAFLDGPAPPEPFPGCGADSDGMLCEAQESCL